MASALTKAVIDYYIKHPQEADAVFEGTKHLITQQNRFKTDFLKRMSEGLTDDQKAIMTAAISDVSAHAVWHALRLEYLHRNPKDAAG